MFICENKGPKIFSDTEQNSSGIRVSEQNKRFSRALPEGRISHFRGRSYPSLPHDIPAETRSRLTTAVTFSRPRRWILKSLMTLVRARALLSAQPSPQAFSARLILDSTVSCDVTERYTPRTLAALSQTSRGQRGKRERLGTRLLCAQKSSYS